MRVIAGTYKGRTLRTPSWEGLRPTSDRLRETLFNILAPRIDGACVLDVCAGTGAVGIEALSRGATRVTFVEQDRRAVALITQNLASLGLASGPGNATPGRYTVARCDALARDVVLPGGPFDLVFLDPPYAQRSLDPWLDLADAHVAPGGLVILEHATKLQVPEHRGTLTRTRVLRQGDSTLTFLVPGRQTAGPAEAEP